MFNRFTVSTFIRFLSEECLVTHYNSNTNIHTMQVVHSTDVFKTYFCWKTFLLIPFTQFKGGYMHRTFSFQLTKIINVCLPHCYFHLQRDGMILHHYHLLLHLKRLSTKTYAKFDKQKLSPIKT